LKFSPKSETKSEGEIKSERSRARATSPVAKKRVREIASPEDKPDTKPEKKRTRSANHEPSGSASPKAEKKSSGEDKKPPKGRLSGDELVALFKAAIGDGPKRAVFDDLIPGRTGKQLHDNWT
jgi:hypothetical protein